MAEQLAPPENAAGAARAGGAAERRLGRRDGGGRAARPAREARAVASAEDLRRHAVAPVEDWGRQANEG